MKTIEQTGNEAGARWAVLQGTSDQKLRLLDLYESPEKAQFLALENPGVSLAGFLDGRVGNDVYSSRFWSEQGIPHNSVLASPTFVNAWLDGAVRALTELAKVSKATAAI